MESWIVAHIPEGIVTALLGWIGYAVKQRDAKIDSIEKKIEQMPFVYAMKDDVKEIKSDVKEIKNHLLNRALNKHDD